MTAPRDRGIETVAVSAPRVKPKVDETADEVTSRDPLLSTSIVTFPDNARHQEEMKAEEVEVGEPVAAVHLERREKEVKREGVEPPAEDQERLKRNWTKN